MLLDSFPAGFPMVLPTQALQEKNTIHGGIELLPIESGHQYLGENFKSARVHPSKVNTRAEQKCARKSIEHD